MRTSTESMSPAAATTTGGITRWNPTPPPPPSPRVLLFPRRRRTRCKHRKRQSHREKLGNVFDQEGDHDSPAVERAEAPDGRVFEEEKWRFQAEVLRAECNVLRMEREFALRKLENNRAKMEKTLRSAVQALVSGRVKISEGKNVNSVLDEEIENLAEKLEALQKSSGIYDSNCSNFDKKASHLQRRIEELGESSEEINHPKELQSPDESIRSSHGIAKCKSENNSPTDMGMLRKKMSELSMDIIDRVEEEYSSVLSSTTNSSVSSSASNSRRAEFPKLSNFSTKYQYQEPILHDNRCSGRCKVVIRRVLEQVRAETEQWCQMQGMLRQVRGEMEQLQASQDFWENQARCSDCEIKSLKQSVQEWQEKASHYEHKANELKLKLVTLQEEIEKAKAEKHASSLCKNRKHVSEGHKIEADIEPQSTEENKKQNPPLPLGKQLAKEKRMLLLLRLKENCNANKKSSLQDPSYDGQAKAQSNSLGASEVVRSTLRDIHNSLTLARAAKELIS